MSKFVFRKTPIALALAATMHGLAAHAAAASGGEFLVNTTTSTAQKDAVVASDNHGNFVVTWGSNSGVGESSSGVYAQRYDASGAPQGSEFHVNTYTTGDQASPAIAMDASGNFVVCWRSDAQDGASGGIYAQLYNAAGVAQGSEFLVNTYTTSNQITPAVAMDAPGNFVVTWSSLSQDAGGGYGIYAQRYNASGVAQGIEFRVNTPTANSQSEPAIAMDTDGDFVVAWKHFTNGAASNEVRAQLYNAVGAAQGTEFQANTYTTGGQGAVALAMDASGDFVVAWQSANQDGNSTGVYARRYDASGNAQDVSEFLVNTTTTNAQSVPAIAMDADGDFVIGWQSTGQVGDAYGYGIYAQRYNASGVRQGSEFRANTYTTGNQISPTLAMDSNGDFVIAWQSFGEDGNDYGVYVQRYAAENLTTSLNASASNQAYSAAPIGPDFLGGGSFSFNASYCNSSASNLTGLYSQVTVLANNNQQENRTRDSSSGNGGAGAQLDIAAANGYSDLLLTNGECVSVPYVIGLTARSPFQFRVNIKGDSGN